MDRTDQREAEKEDLAAQLASAIKSKDNAYWERNQLVVALSKMFPSCLGRHEESDASWERDWMNIVYVEIPIEGNQQLSWHIHDSELPLFSHLSSLAEIKWDGHSTEEKYARLLRLESRH